MQLKAERTAFHPSVSSGNSHKVEEAINLAFEGRPSPVHIHVPENLTHHDVSVDHYRDTELNVKPVLPQTCLVSSAFGAIRSNPGPEIPRDELSVHATVQLDRLSRPQLVVSPFSFEAQ